MSNESVLFTGSCGSDLSFSLIFSKSGLCARIAGKGDMTDYADAVLSPFYPYREQITEVYAEHGVTSIGDNAFHGCTSLTRIRFSPTVKYIGTFSFCACTALEDLYFPEGFEVIGPKAVEKCTSLKTVHFPYSLKCINFKAFQGIPGPLQVSYNGSAAEWQKNVRVSPSARGNRAILQAEITFTAESSRFRRLLTPFARIIREGGDGRMHIIAPNLTVPDIVKKAGDCTMIIFPNGQTMMIDSGVENAKDHVIQMLSSLKLKHLDYFVLTHPHRDHYGAAREALSYMIQNRGSVGTFLGSGYETEKPDEQELYAFLAAHGTDMRRHTRMGETMDIGGVHLWFFNPDDDVVSRTGTDDGTVNNTSVSIRFSYGKSSYLTAGDLYANREQELVARFGSALRSDAMKANHHGAYTSSTEEWFDAIQPKILITEEDGSIWTRFDERLKKKKIRNYKVSECGLCILSFDAEQNYRVKTEF